MLFHPTMGPINQFLKLFIENPPGWTSSSTWALPKQLSSLVCGALWGII